MVPCPPPPHLTHHNQSHHTSVMTRHGLGEVDTSLAVLITTISLSHQLYIINNSHRNILDFHPP